ncbi:MAG: ImmA/IrrE family metallo-endopeptidase [Clostridia bacterium]|nr:ImmA/IrrE family metallo-endopeptidase [Clostridia bacterium]
MLCEQGFTSIFDLARPTISRFHLPVVVHFDSFGSFCERTGADRTVFAPHAGAEGVTIRHNGAYLVLYDERVESERRRTFTLAHEVGHILLAHEGGENTAVEEREANAFAASLLAPEAAVRYLSHRDGCAITEEWLSSVFFLSREAACHRIRDLARKTPRPAATAEITLLLQLFGKLS